MKRQTLITFTALGLWGASMFHYHHIGSSCLLCRHRGLILLAGVIAIGWLAEEKSVKPSSPETLFDQADYESGEDTPTQSDYG